MHMNVKLFSCFFGTVFSIIIITGCFSVRHRVKSDYVLKTEEQLVEQLKSEYPDCFVSCGQPITDQDPSKLVGEWETTEYILQQSGGSKYVPSRITRDSITYTYQFFADGTLNTLVKEHSLGYSNVSQGIWSYTNNILQTHYFIDNVMQRGTPLEFTWFSDSMIKVRQDINAIPKTSYARVCRYDTNGCYILRLENTETETGVILVKTPFILRRVGDAVKPRTTGFQNPIVHDEGLKAMLNASQNAAEASVQLQYKNDTVITDAITDGINAFSSNMSQINNHPPVPVKPTYTPQTKVYTPPAKPTYTPKPIPQYQRIPRASSFGRSGNLPSTDWNTRQNTGLQRVR